MFQLKSIHPSLSSCVVIIGDSKRSEKNCHAMSECPRACESLLRLVQAAAPNGSSLLFNNAKISNVSCTTVDSYRNIEVVQFKFQEGDPKLWRSMELRLDATKTRVAYDWVEMCEINYKGREPAKPFVFSLLGSHDDGIMRD